MKSFITSVENPASPSWNRRLLTVALSLCLLVVTLPLPAKAAMTPLEFETCLLTKINQSRASAGVAPLEMAWDRVFQIRAWSNWMRFNTFRHMTSAERNPILPSGTWTWSENIAMASNFNMTDCTQIHNMFMNSEGHRKNRMSSNFRFAALGAHGDSSGWWVTELYFNAPSYPLASQPVPCASGGDCDSLGFQDPGGRFTLLDGLNPGSGKKTFYYGNAGDVAFSGDWNCDGTETLGLYRQSDGFVYLRNSNSHGIADVTFFFGNAGDVPVAGDFNGDGCDTVSSYRPSEARFYIVNKLGANGGGLGAADFSFLFGNAGDKPFVGDFNGDGVDTIGLHRVSTGLVYFRNSNSTGIAHFQFIYGNPHDMVVAGDWNGNGIDTVGVYRPSDGMVYLRYSNTAGNADAELFADVQSGVVAINP